MRLRTLRLLRLLNFLSSSVGARSSLKASYVTVCTGRIAIHLLRSRVTRRGAVRLRSLTSIGWLCRDTCAVAVWLGRCRIVWLSRVTVRLLCRVSVRLSRWGAVHLRRIIVDL